MQLALTLAEWRQGSAWGRPSSTSWMSKPKATFSPWMKAWLAGMVVMPLCTAWARANPPLSKPKPESRLLASTTRSRAGVVAPASTTVVSTSTSRGWRL